MTLSFALATGWRAFAAQKWLVAVGLVVAGARRALGLPAVAVAFAIVARAALEGFRTSPFPLAAPWEAVTDAVTSPRFLGLVGGLWLAGALLGGVLRVAYVAGALPALAAGLRGEPAGPRRFAAAAVWSFPRVLGAAALGFVVDLAAGLFATTLALAALHVTVHVAGSGASPLLAAAVAFALVVAVVVVLAAQILADAAVTRAALAGEGPTAALASAAARVGRRPAAFLLAALLFATIAAAGSVSIQAGGSPVLGLVATAGPVVLGPQLMLATLSALVAAAVDLWWLGTVAALACADSPLQSHAP